MRNKLILAALLVVTLAALGFTYQATAPKWEYQTMHVPLPDEKLNLLGAQGWELVTVYVEPDARGNAQTVHVFKRPK